MRQRQPILALHLVQPRGGAFEHLRIFPAPIQLSDHKIAWLEAEIDAMIAARAEERNKKPINSRPPEPKRLPGRPRKISPPAEVDSRPAVPLAAAAEE